MFAPGVGGLQQTTNHRIVLPFYGYAALSFIIGALLLFLNGEAALSNYMNPRILAVSHTMALGWGTMMIFGASYQLLPVLIEGKLQSTLLAYLTMIFAGIGIPILVYGFYVFDYGTILPIGGVLVNIAILCYLSNVFLSSFRSEKRNVHAWFIITATVWLFSTTFFGLLLVFNFGNTFLGQDSWSFLSIHAHLGIVGWFLLLVIGVGSRLIPMFLISKYFNEKLLWSIFFFVNTGLVLFILMSLVGLRGNWLFIPITVVLAGVIQFVVFIIKAHKVRIRRKVDDQVKTSILSVLQIVLPVIVLVVVLLFVPKNEHSNLILMYGFTVLFGWITAMILGMTYKTMPFIVWNKLYDRKARGQKTLTPKDLFSDTIFKITIISYLTGFIGFIVGLLVNLLLIIQIASFLLLVAAVMFAINTGKTMFFKVK